MIIYIISATGQVPTDQSIEKILKRIAMESGMKQVDYTYRCGPLVNNPDTFIKEISNMDNKDFDITFIDSDLNVMVLDESTKENFMKFLTNWAIECNHITGELLNEYLIKDQKKKVVKNEY